jgi:DNA-binding NtrC family response regulator
MLQQVPVLIVEDEPIVAIDLAFAVSDCGGEVVGPVGSVDDAFRALSHSPVGAAILDVELRDRDVTPLAEHLAKAGIPFVFHTANRLPATLIEQWPDLPVLLKPSSISELMESLAREMRKRTGSSGTDAG